MDNPKTWLEVSLNVDGEMAEAAAEVISRFAPNGVVIESTNLAFPPHTDFDHDVVGVVSGPLRVYGYLPVAADEEGSLEEKRERLEEALWHLGFIRPLPPPTYRFIEEVNWMEAWKKNFRPIPVGERFMILPAWVKETPAGRLPIRIDPGMAFGTGTHPTTQLSLEFLEKHIPVLKEAHRPLNVIDVGSGSGILSIAALLMGADYALGVDIDPNAAGVAEENAALNGIRENLELETGSSADVLAGRFGINTAPVVVANILAPVIVHLLDNGMGNLVEPDGLLILSGILENQLEGPEAVNGGILAALARHGFAVREKRQIEDWVALTAGR